ncbi:phosphatidate cytidylyltransferase [Rhodospirillum rubrum]|uniref:phosphatidate cytidylyltransferase n=1 Tax=Rhodospirillum rubrum TaxID=1085 RepID=UPI001905F9A4|nr:phosphatidate cytidylyltransferase [Rhodospirillum rubrum]MBK1663289.1 phosphatidate cytidylyltransferase [Rhodospirillum rubrum]MBK1675100.1 phosphatidate cytidylyltransferase [Rhodospirillum rubrum]
MLKTRILSALVLAPPVLAAAFFGSPWFDALAALAGALMAWEWIRLCRGGFGLTGWTMAVLMALTGALGTRFPLDVLLGLALATPMIRLAMAGEDRLRGGMEEEGPWWITAGVPYLGLPLVALVWIRGEGGWETLFWLLAVVWATDIGAYACGRTLGGPLLAPRISPKKTWSGLLGGMGSAALAGWGLALAFGYAPPLWVILFAPVLAVIAQAGDLFESSMKRRFNVKDSSNLIPGHGGLLDRVDGLLAAAPPVACVVALQGGGIGLWQ